MKFTWSGKRPRIINTILKENKVGRLAWPDFKIYNKVIVLYEYNYMIVIEKAMATHSSTLAWRIPGTGEPGGLPSIGLHRVGHDWSDLASAAAAAAYDILEKKTKLWKE